MFLSRVWAWVFLGLMVLFFVVAVPLATGGSVNFLTIRNSQNILVAIIPVLLLGLGQTFVIIAAGIDLSVGWVMSLASVLSALAIRDSLQLWPAAVSLGPRRPRGRRRRRGAGRLRQRRHHRQAQGSRLHRHARHLVHRPAASAYLLSREHDGDRPAVRPPRLRQRRAPLLHPGRRRRALLPSPAGGGRRALAPHGHHLPLSGCRHRRRRRLGNVPSAPHPVRPAHLRDRRQHGRSRAQRRFPSIATSSSFTSSRRRLPASPAGCRRCASPRARRSSAIRCCSRRSRP